MTIRVGVAGLGAVAQSVHLPLIRRRWDLFELAAVADLSPGTVDAVGSQFGVGTGHRYVSLTDMLDREDLDGILLLTSGSHGAAALECLERGVSVFCEKPLAYSLAEVDRLEAAEAQAGRPLLLLGYMKEYDPAVVAMKARLPDPAEIRYVNVEVLHPSGSSQLDYANLRPPARDIDEEALAALLDADRRLVVDAIGAQAAQALGDHYANLILGSLIHDLSLVRFLFGSIRDVETACLWAEQDAPGSVEVSGVLGDDARVHLHWHYLEDYPRYRETVTMHHTTGSFELEFTVPYLLNAPTTLRVTSRAGHGESVEVFRDVTEAFEVELAAFHRMVTEGFRPSTGIPQGRRDVETGQKIARALSTGRGLAIGGEAADV